MGWSLCVWWNNVYWNNDKSICFKSWLYASGDSFHHFDNSNQIQSNFWIMTSTLLGNEAVWNNKHNLRKTER